MIKAVFCKILLKRPWIHYVNIDYNPPPEKNKNVNWPAEVLLESQSHSWLEFLFS